jgi:hypothetical protein
MKAAKTSTPIKVPIIVGGVNRGKLEINGQIALTDFLAQERV